MRIDNYSHPSLAEPKTWAFPGAFPEAALPKSTVAAKIANCMIVSSKETANASESATHWTATSRVARAPAPCGCPATLCGYAHAQPRFVAVLLAPESPISARAI